MKRIISFLFATMLAGQVLAQTTFEIDNLKYTVTDETNHYVSVAKGSTNPTDVFTIPSTVTYPKTDGTTYTVTSIDSYAFQVCSGLTSVTIPNSVTSIGIHAFEGCSGLTTITIPNTVTRIKTYAFRDCSGLTSVTIPYSVTSIEASAFEGCSGLTTINIPESVTSISGNAFRDCSGLTTVTIPNSVTKIGVSAFEGCSGLTSVTIPNSVTSIGNYAFRNCSGLTTVSIPNTVTKIGSNAFYNVKNIIYAGIATGNPWGAITSGIADDEAGFVYGDAERTQLVGYIGNAQSITIPETVTCICGSAFYGCSGLTSVTIPYSVTSIEASAFEGCSGLTTINIPESVTSIGSNAFYNCTSLNTVIIPNSVTSIGTKMFYGCSGLTTVTIPNSVTKIGVSAFEGCSGLTSVTIPNSVTSIGSLAFRYCSNLTDINVESDNTVYTSENGVLFNKAKTNLISFPAGKTEATYTIPESVTSIGNYAFYNCSGLTSVTIPNSVTSIGNYAFRNCSGLTSISIPNLDTICASAFAGCNSLASITIPNSVKKIEIFAFEGCSGLTSVTIPNSVTSIEASVFRGCSGLTTVSIPNTVTKIGSNAFRDCCGLTSITIPNSVTSIGSEAFDGCSGLTSVTIPNSVTSIGGYAFSGCSGLTSVTIPNSVASIDDGAFRDCIGLTSICYEGSSQPTYQSNSFTNVDKTIPVCVPMDYSSTSWCGFTNMYKGHDIVTDLGTATCTESGLSEGKHCSKCGKIITAQENIPALGHSYGTPTYAWAEDGNACTATTVCQRDENHVVTEAATITSEETVAPTCEGEGTTTYTAAFTDSKFTTQTKDVVDIPALQHSYGTPTYAWAEDGSACTATTVCQRDANHVVTENATITDEETVASTCEEMGTTTYTAKFTYSKFSTQTKDVVDIDALGHDYGTPTYEWAEDGSACTATTICQRNENHVVTEVATITDEETIEPSCEEMGTTTYTAKFENELFATQTKDVVDIPANGHKPDSIVFENIVAATCTVAGSQDSVVYCSVCQAELSRNALVISASGHSYSSNVVAPTCTEVGYTTHICSVCNHTFNSDTVPANGHKPDSVVFENIVAATCTMAGSQDSVVYCSVCQTELSRNALVISAKGHSYSTNDVAPTCTAIGYTTHICSVCNHTFNSDTVPAHGHTAVVDSAVAATATSEGLTEGSHCSVCGETILAQVVIPALGEQGGEENQGGNENEGENGNQGGNEGQEENEPEGGNENQGGNNEGNGNEGGNENQGGEIIEPATAVADDAASVVNIFAHHNFIVVENADAEIRVYNIMGGLVATANETNAKIRINTTGVYVVRVGNTTKRVMISD